MNISNLPPTKYSIETLEYIVRILIVSMHNGFSERDYDLYVNLKQITGALGDLDAKHYRLVTDADAPELNKNLGEMFAY